MLVCPICFREDITTWSSDGESPTATHGECELCDHDAEISAFITPMDPPEVQTYSDGYRAALAAKANADLADSSRAHATLTQDSTTAEIFAWCDSVDPNGVYTRGAMMREGFDWTNDNAWDQVEILISDAYA